MKYDVDYFIAKFEVIPEDKWYTHSCNDEFVTKFCALGHCGLRSGSGDAWTTEALGLGKLIESPATVNDGYDHSYQQPTPKQRILAALYDIREKELSEANLKAATIIVNTEVEKVLEYE